MGDIISPWKKQSLDRSAGSIISSQLRSLDLCFQINPLLNGVLQLLIFIGCFFSNTKNCKMPWCFYFNRVVSISTAKECVKPCWAIQIRTLWRKCCLCGSKYPPSPEILVSRGYLDLDFIFNPCENVTKWITFFNCYAIFSSFLPTCFQVGIWMLFHFLHCC